jgi:hypothetical protein
MRRIAGRLVKGLEPRYLESYHEEFVNKFLKATRVPDSKKWKSPILGPRQVAELRKVGHFAAPDAFPPPLIYAIPSKENLMAGKAWPYEKKRKPQPLYVKRKSHRHILGKEERDATIAKNLEDMDERIAAHKKALRDAKPRMDTWYTALNLADHEPALLNKSKGKKKK